MTEPVRRIVIEADGASRGNPGRAAYGASHEGSLDTRGAMSVRR